MKILRKTDQEFIKNLRKNSRSTLTQISRKIHIPISTLYDRLKNHEKDFITKYTTLIDFSKIGYTTKAQIFLKVPIENRIRLESFLNEHQNVNSVYLLNNKYDFLVEGIFENNQLAREFTDYLSTEFNLLDNEIIFIAKDIVKEGFLAS